MSTTDVKTNVMRVLDRLKLPYQSYRYVHTSALSGQEVAAVLQKDPACLFKTLLTIGKSGKHFVFMVPSSQELNLKKAATAANEKSVEMIATKELFPLTGYVHGGCSPIGMKKTFPTIIDTSAQSLSVILCSAGKIGFQVELSLDTLMQAVPLQIADIV